MTNFKEGGGCTFRLLSQKNSRKRQIFQLLGKKSALSELRFEIYWPSLSYFLDFPNEFVTLSYTYRRVGGPVSTNLYLFKLVIIGSGGRGSGPRCMMSFSLPFYFFEGVPKGIYVSFYLLVLLSKKCDKKV